MEKIYDVVILGGGVAGMSAGLYAKRSGKDALIIEKRALGGQVLELNRIQNFPSQVEIDGISLSQMFSKQIKNMNVQVLYDDVEKVVLLDEIKQINCKKGNFYAKSIVIATGMTSVDLGKNEKEFLGKGVSYCAVCDANFFKNRPVFVASKKGSGLAEARILSKVCSSVIVLDSEDMSVFAQANQNEKIEIISNAEIEKIFGQDKVEGVQFVVDGKSQCLMGDALFIGLGKVPATEMFKGQIKLDVKGFILTDEYMQTSAKGVFAVGDVRSGVLKQIVTACNDGAIAGARC